MAWTRILTHTGLVGLFAISLSVCACQRERMAPESAVASPQAAGASTGERIIKALLKDVRPDKISYVTRRGLFEVRVDKECDVWFTRKLREPVERALQVGGRVTLYAKDDGTIQWLVLGEMHDGSPLNVQVNRGEQLGTLVKFTPPTLTLEEDGARVVSFSLSPTTVAFRKEAANLARFVGSSRLPMDVTLFFVGEKEKRRLVGIRLFAPPVRDQTASE